MKKKEKKEKKTKIEVDREGLLTVKPFDKSDLEVRFNIEEIENKPRPFPHNMQTDNMHLLQEKNYHLFEGDYLKPAVYLKDVEFIKFDHLLYDLPTLKKGKKKKKKFKDFFNSGTYMKVLGYRIMLCNPHFTEKQLFDCLYHIFFYYVHIPESKSLVEYVKSLGNYKSLVEGNIKFTEENRKRIYVAAEEVMKIPFKGKIKKQPKVIFNPDYYLTEKEKREISNQLIGSSKSTNTLQEIRSTFLNWDSDTKPTQVNIAEKLGIHVNTVKKYWKQAKEKASVSI